MCMLLTRVDQAPAMLWPWEHKATAALRHGAWVLQSLTLSHAIRDGQQGHAEETVLGPPPRILPSHPESTLSAEPGWQHACREREMHQLHRRPQKVGRCAQEWMTCTRRGVAGGGMWAGLSPPTPSSRDTCNMQNSDQRNSEKMEGKGQGKDKLSNSKHTGKMLCWGRSRVTSVVVLSLIHDRHCLNTK